MVELAASRARLWQHSSVPGACPSDVVVHPAPTAAGQRAMRSISARVPGCACWATQGSAAWRRAARPGARAMFTASSSERPAGRRRLCLLAGAHRASILSRVVPEAACRSLCLRQHAREARAWGRFQGSAWAGGWLRVVLNRRAVVERAQGPAEGKEQFSVAVVRACWRIAERRRVGRRRCRPVIACKSRMSWPANPSPRGGEEGRRCNHSPLRAGAASTNPLLPADSPD